MNESVFDQLSQMRIIPVVTIDDPGSVANLADALTLGGLPAAEVTLRTNAALPAIRELAARDGFLVGAGTVLTRDDVDRSTDAGARFIVSPGFDDAVVERAQQLGVAVIPGVATATELRRALRTGLDVMKIFPAEPLGGPALLRSLAAPFPGVRFFPSGGIGRQNIRDYLEVPEVLAVGTSWMVPSAAVLSRNNAVIRGLVANALALVSA